MEEKAGYKETKPNGWGWHLTACVIGVLVFFACAVTFLTKFLHFQRSSSIPVSSHPGTIVGNYADALGVAMQFFDVQKSGKLVNSRISWRGDSGLSDGSAAGLDLSKGVYDAGDAMKFGFPMAFTATVLSWGILEYGDQMQAVRQLGFAQVSLKWITDYLINAHTSEFELYVQVGDPEEDHNCWERPEAIIERRPLFKINTSYPGTDVAAETAAALAAASLVFRKTNSAYSKLLLQHAEQLFTFANTYRGSYSISIPAVQQFYNSTSYTDELLWAATWLYLATQNGFYLKYVTEDNGQAFGNWGRPSWFSWDDKLPGVHVLLSRVDFFGAKDLPVAQDLGVQMYRRTAEAIMCGLLPDSPTASSNRTESGLIWVTEYDSLLHPVASAFLAVIYSDYMLTSKTPTLYCEGKMYKSADLREFAISQVNYVLGKNPMKVSYLIGYGDRYPQFVHHRGSSIPVDAETGCKDGFKWLNSSLPNPNIAIGAVVGGPSLNETYGDYRQNSMQSEPSIYNSALLAGVLSGLVTTSSVVKSLV